MSFIGKYIKLISIRLSIAGELFTALWKYKLWWAIPIIFILLVITTVLIIGQSTGLVAFIYPFF